jgi:hypothetical protein
VIWYVDDKRGHDTLERFRDLFLILGPTGCPPCQGGRGARAEERAMVAMARREPHRRSRPALPGHWSGEDLAVWSSLVFHSGGGRGRTTKSSPLGGWAGRALLFLIFSFSLPLTLSFPRFPSHTDTAHSPSQGSIVSSVRVLSCSQPASPPWLSPPCQRPPCGLRDHAKNTAVSGSRLAWPKTWQEEHPRKR